MINVPLTVGHTAALSIVWLDQDGNPMLTTPTPDTAPSWSQTAPDAATLTPSSDGMTATEAAKAAGTDVVTVDLSVTIDGVSTPFSAQGTFPISAAPQKLTSIMLAASVS